MKLPHCAIRQSRPGTRRHREPDDRSDREFSQIVPQQQGIGECQDRCNRLYPDDVAERVDCYRDCWS